MRSAHDLGGDRGGPPASADLLAHSGVLAGGCGHENSVPSGEGRFGLATICPHHVVSAADERAAPRSRRGARRRPCRRRSGCPAVVRVVTKTTPIRQPIQTRVRRCAQHGHRPPRVVVQVRRLADHFGSRATPDRNAPLCRFGTGTPERNPPMKASRCRAALSLLVAATLVVGLQAGSSRTAQAAEDYVPALRPGLQRPVREDLLPAGHRGPHRGTDRELTEGVHHPGGDARDRRRDRSTGAGRGIPPWCHRPRRAPRRRGRDPGGGEAPPGPREPLVEAGLLLGDLQPGLLLGLTERHHARQALHVLPDRRLHERRGELVGEPDPASDVPQLERRLHVRRQPGRLRRGPCLRRRHALRREQGLVHARRQLGEEPGAVLPGAELSSAPRTSTPRCSRTPPAAVRARRPR